MPGSSEDCLPADSRREFLALVAAVGLSGCSESQARVTSSPQTPSPTRTSSPNSSSPQTPSPTRTSSPNSPSTVAATPSQQRIGGVPVKRDRYPLRELPYEKRPQFFGPYRHSTPACTYSAEDVQDVENLRIAEVNGRTGHFPLRTTRWLLRLLHCYRVQADDRYLAKAKEMSAALIEDATKTENGGLYFPYRFDKGGSSATMEAPWYSGMCQGVGLSAYIYFHELTGDDEYLDTAHRVLRTFTTHKRGTDGPWTTMVDPDGYYWIEEYPAVPPTHVFNGFCVGLWGLYDYWMHVGTRESRLLLEAGLTTLEQYLKLFRVPGEVSYYGLDGYYHWEEGMKETYPDPYRGNEGYHRVHTVQIDKLYEISGAEFFREMREKFESDLAAVREE